MQTKLKDPTLHEIAEKILETRSLSPQDQSKLVQQTHELYAEKYGGGEPPRLDQLDNDGEFRQGLVSRAFCSWAGISYTNLEDHWDEIRVGIARFYLEQMI